MRTIPELLGHGDVSATMLYAAVRNKGRRGVQSVVDDLLERLCEG